jgi:hypothetical protein
LFVIEYHIDSIYIYIYIYIERERERERERETERERVSINTMLYIHMNTYRYQCLLEQRIHFWTLEDSGHSHSRPLERASTASTALMERSFPSLP